MTRLADGLTIVIPAYNEQDVLPRVLPEVVREAEREGWRVVVVDDGSTDGTQAALDAYRGRAGVDLVRLRRNRGYGGALKAGILRCRTTHVVTMDADGQHRLEDVRALHRFLLEHDADMVIGRRSGQPSAGWYRELGKWLLRRAAKLLLSFDLHDLNSGFKAYRTELAQRYLDLCPDSMAFSDVITLAFVSRRHVVLELPITVRPRAGGRSTISTMTAVETLYEIVNVLMLFNPARIFFPCACLCFAAGLVWGLPIVLLGRGISVGALLAFTSGFLLIFTGLLAEQLSMIRKGLIAGREPHREPEE